MEKLLLIDGHNFLFKAFYGVPQAAKLKNGLQVNAFYGFLSLLRKYSSYVQTGNIVVVFDSDTSKEEFLNYYKNLFETEIVEEYQNPDMVKGKIGEYKVSAARYEGNNTGYVQVYLPSYNEESLNKYFVDFPKIIEVNEYLVEHEKSYGLLNQKGGEIEYTKYFTVADTGDKNKDGKDDVDEFLILKTQFENEYKEKPKYSYEEKTGTMKWQNDEFEVTLTLSKKHGRVYMVLRKPLNKQ